MILYVSGPMSGYQDHNYPAFHAAAAELRGAGYEVLNPAELAEFAGWAWVDYLRRDLGLVLDADGIAVLPYWYESEGARFEVNVAIQLRIPVCLYQHWIEKERGSATNGTP